MLLVAKGPRAGALDDGGHLFKTAQRDVYYKEGIIFSIVNFVYIPDKIQFGHTFGSFILVCSNY